MKNKNLLIVCPSFPDKDNKSYWWIFVKEYINSIKANFDKVYVISSQPYFPIPKILRKLPYIKKYAYSLYLDNYSYDNVEISFSKFFHLPLSYDRKKSDINSFNRVVKDIKINNIKFDIIHAHFIYPSWYLWVKLKEKYNKPLITTWHGYDVYDFPFRNDINKNITKDILKKSDKLLTVSKSNLKCFKKLWFSDVDIIPNWFDSKKFIFFNNNENIKRELNIEKWKKILLTVWNLVKVKNQKTLILACNELKKSRQDFICYIIWEWVLKTELQNLINDLGLNEDVKLLGKKSHDEIPKWMNIVDLFVLPSLSESFGVVNIEALACWTPVVSTINWWSEEIIISDDYWYLLEDKCDFIWLSNLINKSLDKKWDKEKIINYAINNFSSAIIWKKYLELYENNR